MIKVTDFIRVIDNETGIERFVQIGDIVNLFRLATENNVNKKEVADVRSKTTPNIRRKRSTT